MKDTYSITGVILAGGTSKRMGYHKELIRVNNTKLTDILIDQMNQFFNEVIIVSNYPDLYKEKEVLVVQDIFDSKGPLCGLHTALKHSSNNYIYLIACDMPYIDYNYISDVVTILEAKDAYVVKTKEYYEPFHGFYHKKILPQLEDFLQTSSTFTSFLNTLNLHQITDLEKYKKDLFFNINTPNDLYHLNHQNDAYSDYNIIKHNDLKSRSIKDYVVDEYPLVIYLNNTKYVTLLTTPKNIDELVVGYLRSEKLITTYQEVKSLFIDVKVNRVDVLLYKEINFDELGKDKLLVSGCGVGTKFHEALDQVLLDSIDSNYQISKEEIFQAGTTLNNQSGLFKLTGGVHSCLFKNKVETAYFEDIGRHNAVDKVIGHITINQLDTTHSFVFSSGRISSDMLLKCAIAKIPIVISRSAPTSLAVTLALKYGITLIGFARGAKFNIYSHSYRVKK